MKRIIEGDVKICKTCGLEKPITEFNRKKKERLHDCHCKDCVHKKRLKDRDKYKNDPGFRQKRIESSRRYRASHPDAARKTNIKTRYGLTLEDIKNMKELQNYKCFICGADEKELKRGLMIDHSHFNGDIRGLLCDTCNKFMGRYERHSNKCNEYLSNTPYKKGSAKVYENQSMDVLPYA